MSSHFDSMRALKFYPPAKSLIRATVAYLLILLTITGCGQNDDQREFEREAFAPPSGITETDGSGEITGEDPDDWRIAPFYQGLVSDVRVFPNPVTVSDQLTIEISISGLDAVAGLSIAVLLEDAVNAQFRILYNSLESPLPPGLTTATINPVRLGRFNTIESARGDHRIIIFDQQDNVISYGDVRVQ